MFTLVRRAVRFCWGINAIVSLPLAFGRSLHPRAYEQTSSPTMKAVFLVAGLIFAIAWLTNLKAFRGEAISRLFALAASGLLVAEALAIVALGGLPVLSVAFTPVALLILFGVAGVVSYAQKPKPVAKAERPRIAGDRTSRFTDKLIAGFAVLMQIAAMAFWVYYARQHGIQRHSRVPYFALVFLAILFSAATHECGHAVAGWIFDMKLLSFNAGPFTWRKTRGKSSFSFNWNGLLTGGGCVNVVPTHADQPDWHEVWVLLAGPLVNLWLGCFTGVALLIPDAVDPDYRVLFELIATYSVIAAIHNMLPFRLEEGAYSDGARILQLATRSPIVDLHRALLGVQATLVTKRRPRDFNIHTIERAAALSPSDFTGVLLKLCGAHHYFDLGMYPRAAQWLAEAETMVERHAVKIPTAIHTVFIYDHAVLRQDADAVTRWAQRMEQQATQDKKPQRQGVDYWMAQASLLWMQGRTAEARECLEKADAQAKLLPDAGAYNFDRSRCEHLQTLLETAPRIPTPPPPMPEPTLEPILQPTTLAQPIDIWAPEPRTPLPAFAQTFEPAIPAAAAFESIPFEPVALQPAIQLHAETPPGFLPESSTGFLPALDEENYQPATLQWPSSLRRKFSEA